MDRLAQSIAVHAAAVYVALLAGALVAASLGWSVMRRARAAAGRRLAVGGGIVVAAVALFVVLTAAGPKRAVGGFDVAFVAALSALPSPTLLAFLARVTHLGDRATLIVVTIVVAGVFLAGRRWLVLGGWLLACIGNGLLNPALKGLFERARPVHDAAYATVGQYSFPSGHTSGAVVVYGMLAYVGIRSTPRAWHAAIVLVAAAIVVTVASSRAFLHVHWVSDVLAGFASGSAWLTVCVVVAEGLRERGASPASEPALLSGEEQDRRP